MFYPVLLAVSVLLAVAAYFMKSIRLFSAGLAMILMGVSSGLIFSDRASIWGLLFLVTTCFQILNIARLIEGRLHDKYLRNAFLIGGGRLLAAQIALILLQRLDFQILGSFTALLVAQAVVAVVILLLVTRQIILSRPKNVRHFLSDHELPSISVLVPARNEDENLHEMLKTLVANDYPKLEVLVLDDCSVGKNISTIVKQFAHDGVRFVQGDMPKVNWLAKNQAYATLANQASGDWLVFIGVDVRLGVGSLRGLVHYAVNHDKTMLSVVPHRSGTPFWSGFFSPLRYFREFVKPGLFGRSVPGLSTAWIIKKSTYESVGGIESVARKIVPEHYFAKRLHALKQYAFIRTNDYLQVTTSKSLREQIATSLRVIYPSLHRQVEQMLLSSVSMFIFLFLPYVFLINTLFNGSTAAVVLSAVSVACLTISHLLIVGVTNPILWPLAIINFPYLVLQEITLGFISMCKYEFGEMNWKGRNVCLPIMHVVAKLPPLDDPRSEAAEQS